MTTLRKDSCGEDVKVLQNALNNNGASLKCDGIFGDKTKNAVIDFQKKNKLTADGLAGTKTCTALGILDQINEIQKNKPEAKDIILPCEDLKQFKSPHGSLHYGPDSSYSTYAQGGCGVTSFAVVQRALGLVPEGETSTNTIQRLGKYAWQHGYRIKGNGTTAGLFKTNGTKYTQTTNRTKIEEALRSGKFVILLIKKGFDNGYSGNGHYIVAYGISGDYVLLRDVGSSSSSRQRARLAKITTGLKGAYIIEKS